MLRMKSGNTSMDSQVRKKKCEAMGLIADIVQTNITPPDSSDDETVNIELAESHQLCGSSSTSTSSGNRLTPPRSGEVTYNPNVDYDLETGHQDGQQDGQQTGSSTNQNSIKYKEEDDEGEDEDEDEGGRSDASLYTTLVTEYKAIFALMLTTSVGGLVYYTLFTWMCYYLNSPSLIGR